MRRSPTPRRWSSRRSPRATANPAGGEILKDAKGKPTGLLRETASRPHQPRRRRADPHGRRGRGPRAPCARAGRPEVDLEGHHELSGRRLVVRDGRPRQARDRRRPDERAPVDDDSRAAIAQSLAAGRVIGYGNNMLTVRAIKITADGALGSRGAWLLEPYSRQGRDSPGLATTPVERCGSRRRSRSTPGIRSASTRSATAPIAKC